MHRVFTVAHTSSLAVTSRGYASCRVWLLFVWPPLWSAGSRVLGLHSCSSQGLGSGLSSCGTRSKVCLRMWGP